MGILILGVFSSAAAYLVGWIARGVRQKKDYHQNPVGEVDRLISATKNYE